MKTDSQMRDVPKHMKFFSFHVLGRAIYDATFGEMMRPFANTSNHPSSSIRNGIVHFAAPEINASKVTLKFIIEIVDDLAWDFWNETFVMFAENWDDVIVSEGYLVEALNFYEIKVHPNTKK